MLPTPYSDLVSYLDSQPGFEGISDSAVNMASDDVISMLFSHVRPFIAKSKSKAKLSEYLDYGLRSYDSAVLSGVIDNDLLDNDMISRISEEFGVWEAIRSMLAANKEADEVVLKKVISESEGLGLCILASRLELSYELFISIVERKDKNANRILVKRADIPEEWKIVLALAG